MSLVGKYKEYSSCSTFDVCVPSELVWRLTLQSQVEQGFGRITPAQSRNLSRIFDRLIERYDIPRYWFSQLIESNGGNIKYVPMDKARETRRRKTWTKMERDIMTLVYRLQGRKYSEITGFIFGLDKNVHGDNAKKIVRDVWYRKLGMIYPLRDLPELLLLEELFSQ